MTKEDLDDLARRAEPHLRAWEQRAKQADAERAQADHQAGGALAVPLVPGLTVRVSASAE